MVSERDKDGKNLTCTTLDNRQYYVVLNLCPAFYNIQQYKVGQSTNHKVKFLLLKYEYSDSTFENGIYKASILHSRALMPWIHVTPLLPHDAPPRRSPRPSPGRLAASGRIHQSSSITLESART